jgi:hypothetical protein
MQVIHPSRRKSASAPPDASAGRHKRGSANPNYLHDPFALLSRVSLVTIYIAIVDY